MITPSAGFLLLFCFSIFAKACLLRRYVGKVDRRQSRFLSASANPFRVRCVICIPSGGIDVVMVGPACCCCSCLES
ncbi:hypothetical protein DFH27DRAFT_536429 [Peziza echinospora]|nr:hypothetical protein DFH27DRAFT_536429 [Peziza echinospora]